MKIFILFCSFFISAFASPIGGFQGSFTNIVSDAKSAGIGGIGIVDNQNPFGTYYNPALINSKKYLIGISYNHLSLDRYNHSIIVGFKIPPKARASIGYVGSGVKNINGRSTTGKITDSYKWSNQHLFFTFGISPFNKLKFGGKLNIYFQNLIDEVNATGLGLDVGIFSNPWNNLKFAFTVKNIMAKSNWKIDMSDGTMRDYNEYFPLILSFGGLYNFNKNLKIISELNFYNDIDFGYIGNENKYGLEYRIHKFENPIILGFGYNSKEVSLGFSLPFNDLYKMNYAISLSRLNAGNNHIFTWDIQL